MGERSQLKSAFDAEKVTRDFFASRLPWSIVTINKVLFKKADRMWTVSGSYKLPDWFFWNSFSIDIDADSGNVMGFEL